MHSGLTPVEALQATLKEQIEAAKYRQQLWKNGGRVGTYISRPMDATWSQEARGRFKEDWSDKWAGSGSQAGGTPILEDGMEMRRIGFSAHEEEFIEASKLSLNTVAGDRKSTRLNSSHVATSYAGFCLSKRMRVAARVSCGGVLNVHPVWVHTHGLERRPGRRTREVHMQPRGRGRARGLGLRTPGQRTS